MRRLGLDLGGTNIKLALLDDERVVHTDQAPTLSEQGGRDAVRARLGELQPLTGDFGRPEDVAGAALYLATAPFVTGAVLTVDGGWTAR